MFSSPCSLRSTQCAALIALAAAAGISRFEPAPANPAMPRSAASAPDSAAVPSASGVQFYAAAMAAFAPQFRGARVTGNSARDRMAGDSHLEWSAFAPAEARPPAAPAATAPLVFPAPAAPALSVRQHSYPYAAGPPPGGIHSKLRAAGTEVPGDSSARRSQVSRIAPVSFLLRARPQRATDRGPGSARSNFPPSSALRGEPGFLPREFRAGARLDASAWHGTAIVTS
ncbi:MAG: hypothetical protein HY736_21710 [Verrucomicrobia bacterium]|nr:hypothetical protein [Verrucomicrobiota bacterium]